MAKVKIGGRLEIEVPEASLGDVEDAAKLEPEIKAAAERQDFDGLINACLAVVLVMAREGNAGLTVEQMRRALPFRPLAKRLAAAQQAYADVLIASGVREATEAAGGAPGEAVSP